VGDQLARVVQRTDDTERAEYLSITDHFDDFTKGILDTKHLIYYSASSVGLFLTLDRSTPNAEGLSNGQKRSQYRRLAWHGARGRAVAVRMLRPEWINTRIRRVAARVCGALHLGQWREIIEYFQRRNARYARSPASAC